MIDNNEINCIIMLEALDGDPKSKKEIEKVIHNYFKMMQHMKKTSLYDVYMYECNITEGIRIPMEILVSQNKELKKEVNQLRKKLKMIEKYKID